MPRKRDPNRRLGPSTPERDAVIEQLNAPGVRDFQANLARANGADDPEAAIQDAWEGVLAYNDPARIRNSLNGAIVNRGRDQGRRKNTPAGRLIRDSKETIEERRGLPFDVSDNGSSDPIHRVIAHEAYREAVALMPSASLSPNQRYILMRTAQEASDDQIGRELGWEGSNAAARVRTELSRGQAKMRLVRNAGKEK